MVTAKPQIAIKLVSKPYSTRAALGPLMVGVGVGWIFVLLWLVHGHICPFEQCLLGV